MWKKVGVIGPTSNLDNKSSRSRDQNFIEQPFLQMTKQRMSESQIFFEPTDYFFSNHLNKIKDPEFLKHTSQQSIRFNKLTHARSHKQLPAKYSQADTKRKNPNFNQIQEISKRFNEDNSEIQLKSNGSKTQQQNIKNLQSNQKIQSSTSIENNVKTLKQYRSTPQINFTQIKTITEEIPLNKKFSLNKKVEAKKNIEILKKQHLEIKKALYSELSQFKNEFRSMQAEMIQKISIMIESKTQNNKSAREKKEITENSHKNKLRAEQIISQSKKFADKLETLNQKKAELIKKYKSLRAN